MSKNAKNWWKLLILTDKIFISSGRLESVNEIFQERWKMGLMIKLKVTKNQGFTLSLEDKFLEKPQMV